MIAKLKSALLHIRTSALLRAAAIVFFSSPQALVLSTAAQKLVAEKTTIECGKSAFMEPVKAVFELKNKGSKRLNIKDIKPDCGCTSFHVSRTSLGGGDKSTIELIYNGQTMGHYVKQCAVYSNANDKPLWLTMKGIVVAEVKDYSKTYPYAMGDLLADRNVLEFDDVNKGDQPQQTINILNNSDTEMTPNLQHLPPYFTATVTPEKLRPDEAGKITVTLDSRQIHGYGLTQTTVYLASRLGEKVTADNEVPVSVVALPDLTSFEGTNKQYAPKMTITSDTVRLGLIDGKMHKSETIVITNKGRTNLNISSLQMFTPGLKITLGKRELQPGDQAKLKITADRNKLLRQKTKPRILMITNDPDHAKVIINVRIQ